MKVLMITGDKRFGPGNPRYDLQRAQVDELAIMFWGRGSLWPRIPKGKFDVITAQDPFWRGHLAWHIAWLKSARLNIQVHTDLSFYSWLKRWWGGFNLRKADSVRVVSEKIKKQVEQMEVKASIHVVPVFVDVVPFRALTPLPHDQKTILWVGRFEDEKDPVQAIEVLKKVNNKIPNSKLVMLGAGSLGGTLKEISKNLPVEFPGWQDVKPYLQKTDVVLSTSIHESYGASIIEALAAGVPVVAPDVGVAREAGSIVAPREKLADAVVEVLKSDTKGELKLRILNREEWAVSWKNSLA